MRDEDGSLGEGGFKRGTHAALRSVVLTEDKSVLRVADKFRRNDIARNYFATKGDSSRSLFTMAGIFSIV